MSDNKDLVPAWRGENYLASPGTTPFGAHKLSQYMKPDYDDYNVAKAHILQQLGDLSDLDIFGHDVLVAVYIRPILGPDGWIKSAVSQTEDIWQSKVVLVIKHGPEAFRGGEGYHEKRYGEGVAAPAPGDWLFCAASAGLQTMMIGEGANRAQGQTRIGQTVDLFGWDGWPCRLVPDDSFIGRLTKPHSVT